MRFADYFGRAFAPVSAAQFPWMKILKESTVAKMIEVSFSFPFSCSFPFNLMLSDKCGRKKKPFLSLL